MKIILSVCFRTRVDVSHPKLPARSEAISACVCRLDFPVLWAPAKDGGTYHFRVVVEGSGPHLALGQGLLSHPSRNSGSAGRRINSLLPSATAGVERTRGAVGWRAAATEQEHSQPER
eukprot:GHVT01102607.1.p2 GENE.GHVT01102607.1~~GHVT01102607.1.p2  ORF type:complete len:118 (-),score=16.86 GHVT01102607.1:591-944(-)